MIVKNNGVVDDDDLVLPPCSREQGMAPNPEWGCSDSGEIASELPAAVRDATEAAATVRFVF